MNGSLHTIDGRSVLKFERRLAHPPEKVWRAITETEHLAQWFPAEMQGERKQGAPIRFVFAGDEAPPENGEITEYDPPRLFSYTWGESELHWELRPDGDGCLLLFGHTFDERPNAASFATGWQLCLDWLERALSGRPEPTPAAEQAAAMRTYRARHEGYVEVFGLLEGTAERSGTGWRVRFARLLPYPAEEVWASLAGTRGAGRPGDAAGDGGAGRAVGGERAAATGRAAGADGAGDAAPQTGRPAPAAATSRHAPAGPVIEVEPRAVLAYDSPDGAVRWDLTPGPGGTLVELTQQTMHPVESLAGWHARLEEFAAGLAGHIGSTPAEALHARYTALVEG